MSSRAFKHYIRFIMSKYDIKRYNIKFKIAVNYNMTNGQLDAIENLSSNDGLINKDTFYNTISTYSFLKNYKKIDNKDGTFEMHEEEYEVNGKTSLYTDVPDEISFELDDTIQKLLNIPAYIEYLKALKNPNVNKNNLKNFKSNYISYNDRYKYIKSTYSKGYGLIEESYKNNEKQVLQLSNYDKEECPYSNHAYKYTFGVLIYLEDDKNVCPICYSESNDYHMILDNFKITWDSTGIISLKAEQ